MENNEIYIDGVNVAGCAYFRESRCFDCGTQAICCQHPNCYYKQFKRLEQENEVLTRENENRNDWITSLNKKCEELIKEKLNYRSALEEIRNLCNKGAGVYTNAKVVGLINEVLNEQDN